jgi:transcriptional regulator with XRE-family HTH domain
MEERLLQLLKSEGINPTKFAERIGVQRSSISHILSGRNKPSYDFIVKILEKFPNLNPDWLLRGKGLMYKNDIPLQPSLFDSVSKTDKGVIPELPGYVDKTSVSIENPDSSETDIRKIDIPKGIKDKRIIRVLMFYSDMTFSEFTPEN